MRSPSRARGQREREGKLLCGETDRQERRGRETHGGREKSRRSIRREPKYPAHKASGQWGQGRRRGQGRGNVVIFRALQGAARIRLSAAVTPKFFPLYHFSSYFPPIFSSPAAVPPKYSPYTPLPL
jgi:hypothetical protein